MDPESFVRGGPILTTFFYIFLVDEGREDPKQIPLKVGHHLPTSKAPFKWRFAGGRMMAQH